MGTVNLFRSQIFLCRIFLPWVLPFRLYSGFPTFLLAVVDVVCSSGLEKVRLRHFHTYSPENRHHSWTSDKNKIRKHRRLMTAVKVTKKLKEILSRAATKLLIHISLTVIKMYNTILNFSIISSLFLFLLYVFYFIVHPHLPSGCGFSASL